MTDGAGSAGGRARPRGVAKGLSVVVRVGLSLGLLALGLVIAAGLVMMKKTPTPAEREERALVVRGVRVTPSDAPRGWVGYGTARALRAADVAAEVTARVVDRPERIEAGVRVAMGDLLVKLDASDFEDRAEAAQQAIASFDAQIASLDVDRERLGDQIRAKDTEVASLARELEKLQDALERDAARPIEIDRLIARKAQVEGQRVALIQQRELIPSRRKNLEAQRSSRVSEASTATRDAERTSVVAPMDGALQSIEADVGERVREGDVVARVVDLRTIEVPLRLPASAMGRIGVGDEALLRAEGVPGVGAQAWRGRVERIAPEADPRTRSITVFVVVEQDPSGGARSVLSPGRFVSGRMYSSDEPRRIIVPRSSIEEDLVMVASPNGEDGAVRVQPRAVDVLFYVEGAYPGLDPRVGEWAVIGDGLSPGELVVTTNLDQLRPGMAVSVRVPEVMASDRSTIGERGGNGG